MESEISVVILRVPNSCPDTSQSSIVYIDLSLISEMFSEVINDKIVFRIKYFLWIDYAY